MKISEKMEREMVCPDCYRAQRREKELAEGLILNLGVVAMGDPAMIIIQRAVKPRPSGRGYKAHLDWNFCL